MRFLLALAVCLFLCINNNVFGVYNGTTVPNAFTFPSQVSIQLPNNVGCGGTILNGNHVLTTASCVLTATHYIPPFNQVTVFAGAVAFGTGTSFPTIAIFPHIQYNHLTFQNDIAVIRIQGNFQFNLNIATHPIAPVILQDRIVPPSSECIVIGWGVPIPATPLILNQLLVIHQHRDIICNSEANHNGRVFESMLCASTMMFEGVAAPCQQSRGGGLYCNGLLTGIPSNSLTCNDPISIPAIYTQVRFFTTWIQQQLVNQNIPAPGIFPPPLSSSNALISSTLMLIVTTVFAILY